MNIIRYMPLAIGSYRLLGIFGKKWLGDDFDSDSIGKAPKGNITTEMGLMIGDIADSIRNYPDIIHYLEISQNRDFLEGLKKIEGSEDCVDLLEHFFVKYGMRCTGEIDITHPRWKEDPREVISLILGTIKYTKPYEHRGEFRNFREQGENAAILSVGKVQKTRFGFIKAFIMKRLVIVYRNTIGIREHPKYFLINIFGLIKDELLIVAENFVKKGLLEAKEDIYFLTLDEIDDMIQGKIFHNVYLLERKLRYEQDSKLKPPRIFTETGEILTVKAHKKLPLGTLSGTAASSGIIEGRARVVNRLEDAQLQKGDILVTSFTDPAWTTLFGIAGAVVTEAGGLLTHGAVVAREYGIPAVVGVDNATTIIPDGSYIRVNGTEGYVEIVNH